jgi:hypothetical protein
MRDYKVHPVPYGWHVYVRSTWFFIPYWKRLNPVALPLHNAVTVIELHVEAEIKAQAKFNQVR